MPRISNYLIRTKKTCHYYFLNLARLFNRSVYSYLPRIPWKVPLNYYCYIKDLLEYRKLQDDCKVRPLNLWPCLYDRTSSTPVERLQFYQDTWAARKIFQNRPAIHVDIGSTVLFVGIISQFTKTYSIEIRPLDLKLDNLEKIKGSLTVLPFQDNTLHSISSLSVIEHIGLGRYGDPLDPKGTEKAISELVRVMASSGNLYLSVPIAAVDSTYFNAHRAFNISSFISKFKGLKLIEMLFIQNNIVLADSRDLDLSLHTTGLFHFRK